MTRAAWILLIVLLSLMLIANLSSFPFSVREIAAASHGTQILDARLYYSADEANRTLDQLGPVGRHGYVLMFLWIDIALPAVAAAFTWTVLTTRGRRRWRVVGILAAAFDYAENAAVLAMIAAYPHRLAIAHVAGAITTAKWIAYAAAITAVITALVRRRSDTMKV